MQRILHHSMIYLATYTVLLAQVLPATASTITTGTVSIADTSGYLAQRECVKSVLWSGRIPSGESNVVDWLGCTNHLDSCFCRPDLASSASSLLTSAINTFCSSDSADVAGGVSVYNSYCSEALRGMAVLTSAGDASATGGVATAMTTATVTATQTVISSTASVTKLPSPPTSLSAGSSITQSSSPTLATATANPASQASSSGSGSLSLSDKIALGVGLGVGVPTVVLSYLSIRNRRKRQFDFEE